MEQYHYIWVFKALFILAGMVAQFIGYLYIKNGLSDKYAIDTSIGEFGIGLTGKSIGMLVMVFGAILILAPFMIAYPFEYEIVGNVPSHVNRPVYIDIARATVSCYGVFIFFLGVWMLKKDIRDEYEFKFKLGKSITKLSAAQIGIFVMAMSLVIILAPIKIPPTWEYNSTRIDSEIKVPPITKPPVFKLSRELEDENLKPKSGNTGEQK